jgi:hypothetical protein
MAKQKQRYNVYYRLRTYNEITNEEFISDFAFAGETWAVSERQAINNFRHREYGDFSQHLPIYTSGHYDAAYEWKAEVI